MHSVAHEKPQHSSGPGSPRVAVLLHSYWPDQSPPQRRWGAFAKEFRAAGWDVDFIVPVAHFPHGRRHHPRATAGRPFRSQTGPHVERILRVPYLRHPESRAGRLADQIFSAALSVPAGLTLPRPDVVVTSAPSLPILGAGYALARARRVPLVVEMRDAWPDLARDARLVRGNVKSLAERAVDFVQHRADHVVTVTEGFARTLRERGIRSVSTISNGLPAGSVHFLPPPPAEKERLDVLYLGNHGESQRLDVAIQAAALVGPAMHLHLVGHGIMRPSLQALARRLDAPVTFYPPAHGQEVLDHYARADSCIISLRDDWRSFETTIPSKTYEVLAVGRHITAVVKGEAARVIEAASAGTIVPCTPRDIADLWTALIADRSQLNVGEIGRDWVQEKAMLHQSGQEYLDLFEALVGRR